MCRYVAFFSTLIRNKTKPINQTHLIPPPPHLLPIIFLFLNQDLNGQKDLCPRLCHLKKGPSGYGFNLHSEKSRPGQFIRSVDPDSPASRAGLRPQDRLVEVTPHSAHVLWGPFVGFFGSYQRGSSWKWGGEVQKGWDAQLGSVMLNPGPVPCPFPSDPSRCWAGQELGARGNAWQRDLKA